MADDALGNSIVLMDCQAVRIYGSHSREYDRRLCFGYCAGVRLIVVAEPMELVSPGDVTDSRDPSERNSASRKQRLIKRKRDLSGYYSFYPFFYRNKFDFRSVFFKRGKPVMTVLLRYMWADVLKMKRTPFIWMHVAAPVLCAGFFLLYMMYGRIQEPYVLYSVFFNVIAVLYPLIISIVCGMSASVEEQAGYFQMMLAVPHSKIVSFAGKLLLLLLLNVLSAGLATCLYLAGLKFVLHINDLPYLLFLKGGAWLIAGSIPLYMISFFVGIQYGMGPSGLLGGAGLLMAALMNTGLGDIIWRFFPWAWSVRLSGLAGLLHFDKVKKEFLPYVRYDMRFGEIMLYFSIVILCLAGLYWCRRWEGRRSYE